MSAIWMRLRSDLRRGMRSALGLAILIAIAGAAVLAPLAGARRTQSAYERFLAAANVHDGGATGGAPGIGFEYTLDVEELVAHPAVKDHESGRMFFIAARTESGVEFPIGAEAVIVRPGLYGEGRVSTARVFRGRFPDRDRVDEVTVGYGLSAREGIVPGDRITIDVLVPSLLTEGFAAARPVDRLTATVVGVVLVPGSIPPSVEYGQIFATPAFEARYADTAANVRLVNLELRRGKADLPLVNKVLETSTGGQARLDAGSDRDAGVRRSIDLYVVALQAFSALAAVAALLILMQVLSRQVVFGSNDHPALRSIGMTRGQLAATTVIRMAVAVGAGTAGAIAFTYALSPFFPLGIARVVEPDPGPSFDGMAMGGGAAAFFALAIAAAVAPALRAARHVGTDEDSIRPEGQAQPSRVAAWLSGSGAPASVVAGVRLAFERGRGPTSTPVRSAVVASAIAVASIATLVSFGTSMRHLVDTPRLYGWNWDLFAGNPYAPGLAAGVVPVLDGQAGIAEFSSGSSNVPVRVAARAGSAIEVDALALDARRGEVFPPMLEGRWPADDDEIALGTATFRTFDLQLGDTVELAIGERRARLTVVGRTVFPVLGDQFGAERGQGAGLTVAGLRRVDPGAPENVFPVRFRTGFGFNDLPAEARSLFPLGPDSAGPVRPVDLDNLSRVEGAPIALVALVALLGVATIAHALATSVGRRRRDLAILKTLGFVKRQVRVAVAVQASALGLVALAFGIPIGLIAGRSAWFSFADRQGVVPEALLGSRPVVALIPATILLANLVAALPGRAAARLAPATVLRTE